MLADLMKLQLDMLGARGELACSLLGSAWLDSVAPAAPRSQAVLTLPGFLASDQSLLRLNRFLSRQGWQAESWGLGRNLGPRGKSWSHHLDLLQLTLAERIQALADQTSAPVVLLGQSLGGVYARDLAVRLEPWVDRVITLGSPTFHPYRKQRHNRVIGSLGEWMSRRSAAELAGRAGLLHLEPGKPAIPLIAFHSPIDGIVAEDSCLIPQYIVDQSSAAAPRENIRVFSTHIGMSVNPWAWLAIADRLARKRDDWQPFDPGNYFSGPMQSIASFIYPPQPRSQQAGNLRRFIEAGQR
jgi:pimeloyl-ACP methyl ester carboxylesterase